MTIEEIYAKRRAMIQYFTKEEILQAVKQNGDALQFANIQDKDIILEAVKQDGYALQYVKLTSLPRKELTVSEISDLLGYDVVIVK